ncbi:MAG: SEC-C metal-binding domain-containing protein, partial [Lysobacterales bacterium]
RKQPVLVGTTSVENSEMLAKMLADQKVPHEVLNAKQHEREAQIVAQAGRPGAITIATNMAGRGTDIVLGGNVEAELAELPADASESERERVREQARARHQEVIDAGGLRIIGTERHESRRIDNQLRGRSGRQGDPGSSRFYLSLEDTLMRIFAPEWVMKWMQAFGMKDEDALEDRMVSRQIEKAQRKVEAHNFDIRKHLLEYDDVANDQRKVIYQQRNELLEPDDIQETIENIRRDVIEARCRAFVPADSIAEHWDLSGLERTIEGEYGIPVDARRLLEQNEEISDSALIAKVQDDVDRYFREKETQLGSEFMRTLEKHFLLRVLDTQWRDHLANMDYLRQGIHLRGYAQKQPKQEYKREAFELFGQMLERVKQETTVILARVRVQSEEDVARAAAEEQQRKAALPMQFQHQDSGNYGVEEEAGDIKLARQLSAGAIAAGAVPKVGRNEPCPCGSGRKYKHCHGSLG